MLSLCTGQNHFGILLASLRILADIFAEPKSLILQDPVAIVHPAAQSDTLRRQWPRRVSEFCRGAAGTGDFFRARRCPSACLELAERIF